MATGVGRQAASRFFPASAPAQQKKLGGPPHRPIWGGLCMGHPCMKHLFFLHCAPWCKHLCTLPSMVWKQLPHAIPVPMPLRRKRGWEEEEDGGREEPAHVGRKQGPGAG